MKYIKISFSPVDEALKDILIAVLADAGFEGFEEEDKALYAYINEEGYHANELDIIAKEYGVSYSTALINEQNWNAEWEKSFEPVIVDGFCTVRADFHTFNTNTPYEIIVTPKMSFGTGHHATTQLMIQKMRDISFIGKKVFDFGTGTGILAILAEKLGAENVLAADNDEWSYDNAIENVKRNNCNNIEVVKGSIEQVPDSGFDIILANINRHILLQYMDEIYAKISDNGLLLLSGLLTGDEEIIKESAIRAGFRFKETKTLNKWIEILFEK